MSDRLTAFVLGGADTVWDDLEMASRMCEPDLIVACNNAGRDYEGQVDHFVTMHGDLLEHWRKQRRANGLPDPKHYWHAENRPVSIPEAQSIRSWGGSSGLLCVTVALEVGATHVILCGVPMRQHNKHYDDEKPWREARMYWDAWKRNLPAMEGRVKSMGGYTADWLGFPTRGWLDACDDTRRDQPIVEPRRPAIPRGFRKISR